jgi:hypothetical protein
MRPVYSIQYCVICGVQQDKKLERNEITDHVDWFSSITANFVIINHPRADRLHEKPRIRPFSHFSLVPSIPG